MCERGGGERWLGDCRPNVSDREPSKLLLRDVQWRERRGLEGGVGGGGGGGGSGGGVGRGSVRDKGRLRHVLTERLVRVGDAAKLLEQSLSRSGAL